MAQKIQLVITMTSWPKRIKYVAKAIYSFFTTQTVKPDIFYLWLSSEEFPNKEKDLPEDLILICEAFSVKIQWVKENEYCHKRWYVYPKHYNDIVVCIDDDCEYDTQLLKFASNITDKKVYTIFNNLTNEMVCKSGINITLRRSTSASNRIKLSGNSIYPPQTFPLDAIKPENIKLRKKYCKNCDESWLMPFLIHNNIQRSYSYKQKVYYNETDPRFKSTAVFFTSNTTSNVRWKHLQIYIVLRLFPELMKSWKQVFPAYNDKDFETKTVDYLITLLK